MVTSGDYSAVADRLTQLAGELDAHAENFSSARSTAASAVEDLGSSWAGPLADLFLPAATAFVETTRPPAAHSTEIAKALRTLAAEASSISGELSILENADEPDESAVSSKAGEWLQAGSRFRNTVDGAVAGLGLVDGVGLVLPGPTTNTEYAAAVIEELGGADGVDELIRLLAEDEDAEGFQLLADTLGRSLHGLSPEEIIEALQGIHGPSRHLLLMASGTLPPEITEVLLTEQYLSYIHNDELALYEQFFSREFLEAVTGFDVDGDNPDVAWAQAEVEFWRKILALDPASIELVAALPSGSSSGYVPQVLRIATIDHLVKHPEVLDRWLDFGLDIGGDAEGAVTNLMEVLHPADHDGALREVVAAYTAHATDGVYVTVDDVMAEDPRIGSDQAAAELALRRSAENLERAGHGVGVLLSSAEDAGIDIDYQGGGIGIVEFGVGQIPIIGTAYDVAQIAGQNISDGPNRSEGDREDYQKSLPLAFDVVTGGLPASQRQQVIDDLGFELEDGHVVIDDDVDVDIDALIVQHPEHAEVLLYANEFADGMQSGGAG